MKKVFLIIYLLSLILTNAFSDGLSIGIAPLSCNEDHSFGPPLSDAVLETLKLELERSGNYSIGFLTNGINSSGDLSETARDNHFDYIIFGEVSRPDDYRLKLALFDYRERTVTQTLTSSTEKAVDFFWLSEWMLSDLLPAITGETNDAKRDTADFFDDGNGTENSPYLISRPSQLININLDTGAAYRLTSDLDLGSYEWVPLNEFTGTLDGNGHTIRNVVITTGKYKSTGLFCGLDEDSKVKNLIIENLSFITSAQAGGLAGYNNGQISHCRVSGRINAEYLGGGLVGINNGSLEDCFAEVTLEGQLIDQGGLAGTNWGTITRCAATGDVSNNGRNSRPMEDYPEFIQTYTANDCGGLVGYNAGTISQCWASGNVACNENDAGGLVGCNEGIIENCYANGRAKTRVYNAGGLVGINTDKGTIRNCLATGRSQSGSLAGGICGNNLGLMENSLAYRTQTITISGDGTSSDSISNDNRDGVRRNCVFQSSRRRFLNEESQPYSNWDYSTIWQMTDKGPQLRNAPLAE